MLSQRICSALIVCIAILSASPDWSDAQDVHACLWSTRTSDCSVFPPAAMGIGLCVGSPASTVYGHLPQSGAIGEVAVIQSVISAGEEVPLPTYADGTPAIESEVFWTAQLWFVQFPLACGVVRWGGGASATFNGRQLVSTTATIPGPVSPPSTDGKVLVNVVALRHSATPTKRESVGSLKARYRPGASATPQDK